MSLQICKVLYIFVLYYQVVLNLIEILVTTHIYLKKKINVLPSLHYVHVGEIWEIHSIMAQSY